METWLHSEVVLSLPDSTQLPAGALEGTTNLVDVTESDNQGVEAKRIEQLAQRALR